MGNWAPGIASIVTLSRPRLYSRDERREAPSPPWTHRPEASFPRWVAADKNLREVGPGLYVGDQESPRSSSSWGLVVDLCGASGRRSNRWKYPKAAWVLQFGFLDGHPFPDGMLDRILSLVRRHVVAGQSVLLHCAAGHSRSASAAYAMLRVGWRLSHEDALGRVVTARGLSGGWPMTVTFGSARRWAEDRLRKQRT